MDHTPDFESSVDAMPVHLEQFEGPLDLLLHLIRRNEVNIYDIPIALITSQYLGTIELMQVLNLDVAGDFLVMAATLFHIKSKTLLPRPHTAPRPARLRPPLMSSVVMPVLVQPSGVPSAARSSNPPLRNNSGPSVRTVRSSISSMRSTSRS